MKLEIGNIITTTQGEQLLITQTFKKGVRAQTKIKNGSKFRFIQNNLIAEVQYLHGDRFSYELRKDWLIASLFPSDH